ncbi:MAG: potassium-transporting ATPase subunit KdpA [Candidatus Wallbacteria bacterium]
MFANDYFQLIAFLCIILITSPLLGQYMAEIFQGRNGKLARFFEPFERAIYKICGIDPNDEMSWSDYIKSLLFFNLFGFLFLYSLCVIQGSLPLNPQNLKGTEWHLAFNTAVSFMTNTNWQSYNGETTFSYLVQMLGFTVQNFLSAATGIAVVIAFSRAMAKAELKTAGNFFTDIVRSIVYVLIPLSVIMSLLLVSQGTVQTIAPYTEIKPLEGGIQTIPLGPVASQIAIKQLGTNGGGFFGANGCHPFENPTPLSNFLEVLAIFLIPAALVFTYGQIVNNSKHAVSLFGAMLILFLAGLGISLWSEYGADNIFGISAIIEGKELRFGIFNSVLWSVVTTCASCGAINCAQACLSPISIMISTLNMMFGEVIFGGAGSGLYGMIMFAILTVFIAGLMVGRTPEYLGKKIGAYEVKMAVLAVLAPSIIILSLTAVSCVIPEGISSALNRGPRGFLEILYAFTSAAANNGSALAGLNANTPYYNVLLGLTMLAGRFIVIVPVLLVGKNLAAKKITPESSGTFPVFGAAFSLLLISVILIIGALTFFPALSIGPIAEYFLKSRVF